MQQVSMPDLRDSRRPGEARPDGPPDLALVTAAMTAEGRRFGANLKRLREDKRPLLTQGELARAVGVSFGLISQYERGVVQFPRRDIVERLARALGTTAAVLLGDEPPPAPPAPAPLFPVDARIVRFIGPVGANPSQGAERLAAGAASDQFDVVAIGDCLSPEVQDGDTLRLDVDAQPATGRIVVVAVHGELFLKKVLQRTTGNLFLWSKRGELVTPEEGVEVLGVVIQISRPVVQTSYNAGSNGGSARPDLNVAG